MKKTTKESLGKRVAKYGALSLAIAGVADASGQVIYTDVDPDFAGGLGDSFAIDFDGDSVDDITITQFNNGNYELVQADADAAAGVIAASNGAYFYASNLSFGAVIDGSGAFNSFGDMCSGVGYAGSQFCGSDGYIGVQFTAGGGTTHYAWVRVGTGDSSSFTVFEYAFQATPDTAITAGEEPTAGVGDNVFQDFVQFIDADGNLNVSAATVIEDVTIHNIAGQSVIQTTVNNNRGVIGLNNLSNGIYIATVSIEGQRKSFKLVK